MTDVGRSLLTPRLRLVPIGPENADDFHRVHTDDAVVAWYDGWNPKPAEARERAGEIAAAWRHHGIHKWMAYHRHSGDVVGRGGLSRTPVDDDWGQLYAFLPDEPWVTEAHSDEQPFRAHARWLETGWALRRRYWGHGYASEIGHASLSYAFDVLDMGAVVSCAARHNVRSLAVMERIGMRSVGEIRSRGMAEGDDTVRDDAPFRVCVRLAGEVRTAGRDVPARARC